MRARALDKVFTFAGEVLYERQSATLTKLEATPGDRSDLRILGQLVEPQQLDERRKCISYLQLDETSLEVFKQIDDDQRFGQKLLTEKSRTSRLQPCVPYRDSENHAPQNGELERHEVLNIEDRVQCHTCFKDRRPGEIFCTCGSILEGITAEVKKRAEQRISSRFIIYVPGIHRLSLKNIQKGSALWKPCRITTTQENKRLHGFRTKVRNSRGALPPRGRVVPNAHARTRILASRLTSFLRTNGLVTEAYTISYNPRRRQRHQKNRTP